MFTKDKILIKYRFKGLNYLGCTKQGIFYMVGHQSGKRWINAAKKNIRIHEGSEHLSYKGRKISLVQLRRISYPVHEYIEL
jgi:hypothetical protein